MSLTDATSLNDPPRVSVVVRTQGRRTEALREALLSLTGQHVAPHEVIVILHCSDKEAAMSVGEAVDWADRIGLNVQLATCSTGNRGAPLNVGLNLARGSLVSFLDDDDHALPNFVSTWHGLHSAFPGSILRARVGLRPIEYEGQSFVASLDRASPTSHRVFSWIDHFQKNETPICGMGFPLDLLRRGDHSFDETLSSVEDWDFLMRVALSHPVVSSPSVVAIYNQKSKDTYRGDWSLESIVTETETRIKLVTAAQKAFYEKSLPSAVIREFEVCKSSASLFASTNVASNYLTLMTYKQVPTRMHRVLNSKFLNRYFGRGTRRRYLLRYSYFRLRRLLSIFQFRNQ